MLIFSAAAVQNSQFATPDTPQPWPKIDNANGAGPGKNIEWQCGKSIWMTENKGIKRFTCCCCCCCCCCSCSCHRQGCDKTLPFIIPGNPFIHITKLECIGIQSWSEAHRVPGTVWYQFFLRLLKQSLHWSWLIQLTFFASAVSCQLKWFNDSTNCPHNWSEHVRPVVALIELQWILSESRLPLYLYIPFRSTERRSFKKMWPFTKHLSMSVSTTRCHFKTITCDHIYYGLSD